MSRITIVPIDGVVVVDNSSVMGVNMDSVDPQIHAIQFNPDTNFGFIEYKPDPETNTLPPQQEITSIEPWQPQIDEAREIIYCHNNPKTFYRTTPLVGTPVVVTAKGWPQPDNTTDVAPPEKTSDNTSLYWSGTEFVWSVFPVDLDLAAAQSYVINSVNQDSYSILQPSDWYVVRQAETGVAVPEEWNTWRASVRTEANSKIVTIRKQDNLEALETYCESTEFKTWPTQPA